MSEVFEENETSAARTERAKEECTKAGQRK